MRRAQAERYSARCIGPTIDEGGEVSIMDAVNFWIGAVIVWSGVIVLLLAASVAYVAIEDWKCERMLAARADERGVEP